MIPRRWYGVVCLVVLPILTVLSLTIVKRLRAEGPRSNVIVDVLVVGPNRVVRFVDLTYGNVCYRQSEGGVWCRKR